MEVLYPVCCALDVHQASVTACLRAPGDGPQRRQEVRTFGTTTPELLRLAGWLTAAGCTHVAMESTGIYWRPVYNILEGRFELSLVNAQHVKMVPGRKTDVRDSEWLAQLQHLLRHIEFLDGAIAACDRQVETLTAPHAEALTQLDTIPGVARRTAEVIAAELGCDMTRFPTAGHAASWTGLCPGNHESAGKRLSGRTRHANRTLRQALVESARGAVRKRDSYLAAQYRRLVKRRGDKKAIVAVAHSILVIAYHVLRDGQPYRELGGDYFERLNADRLTRYHTKRLAALGYTVTLTKDAA